MLLKENVKQRRQERIHKIINKQQEIPQTPTKYELAPKKYEVKVPDIRLEDPEYVWKLKGNAWLESKNKDQDQWNVSPTWSQFKIKVLLSVFLFLLVWTLFQIEHPLANKGQKIIVTLLSEDFQFEKVAIWYEQAFQGAPSFIPTFVRNKEAKIVDAHLNSNFYKPAAGVLKEPYSVSGKGKGIQLTTKPKADIVALDTGRVLYVGHLKESGLTIIIQHANQLQSIYGFIQDTPLQLNDWVQGGQWIGTLTQTDETQESVLYFAIKQENQYLNPTDLISFD